ncbi:MAG: hypothetical protein Q4P18_05450 [Methanobrevibacter sp.]|uniref:hypothetical protein n=1 Tax=Methanobrevibacter sp. TaxID=66852 RepID=UPI0026DF393A|nr:hypothetical protein [Methanobrevibacter sp.]MDO5848959.1 hypothetical protein [Methanobrevibacter sp.]
MVNSENKNIDADDINYAIYKLGNWENEYEINQVGLSNEIPVTESTVDHVKLSMDEIRRAEFDLNGTAVNGFVVIALQINPKVREMDLNDIIELEQKEYDNIVEELDKLELLDNGDSIPLENEDYLIYKLEKECHVTQSIPANKHTLEHHKKEMERIDESIL